MPLGKDVKHSKLAEYALTGGQIKNVILNAARMAVFEEAKKVSLKHIEGAVKKLQETSSLMGKERRQHIHMDIEPKVDVDKVMAEPELIKI